MFHSKVHIYCLLPVTCHTLYWILGPCLQIVKPLNAVPWMPPLTLFLDSHRNFSATIQILYRFTSSLSSPYVVVQIRFDYILDSPTASFLDRSTSFRLNHFTDYLNPSSYLVIDSSLLTSDEHLSVLSQPPRWSKTQCHPPYPFRQLSAAYSVFIDLSLYINSTPFQLMYFYKSFIESQKW